MIHHMPFGVREPERVTRRLAGLSSVFSTLPAGLSFVL